MEKLDLHRAGVACYSAGVIIPVIGAPTAPRRRIIRRLRIVRGGGRVVVAVRVIVRLMVGVREHGTKREGSEPDADRGSGADPTRICRPRRRSQPDSSKD